MVSRGDIWIEPNRSCQLLVRQGGAPRGRRYECGTRELGQRRVVHVPTIIQPRYARASAARGERPTPTTGSAHSARFVAQWDDTANSDSRFPRPRVTDPPPNIRPLQPALKPHHEHHQGRAPHLRPSGCVPTPGLDRWPPRPPVLRYWPAPLSWPPQAPAPAAADVRFAACRATSRATSRGVSR